MSVTGSRFMNLVRLKGLPILRQLHIEEELLRTSSVNWCIVNDGTNEPAIVMGVSGVPRELLEIGPVLRDGIHVIRRFTGGGTIVVDSGTVFVALICKKDAVAGLQPYPRPIMSWSGQGLVTSTFVKMACYLFKFEEVLACSLSLTLYVAVSMQYSVWPLSDRLHLLHYYVFGNCKFGGNAQSITKNWWIHYTSFFWDYDVRNMAYLEHPKRVPKYRLARNHLEFTCRMKDYMPREVFIDKTVEALETKFSLRTIEFEALELDAKFSPSTKLLLRHELETMAFAS
ncbi:hypothetical protein FNV43_RR09795 [Rhamnella rubrinervis]|uniref:BPL/LPL catalytic domain-containing protein n=1 Tax=Rhamnella rubrinervis TaxID=2594499 RepID=A0A8K0HAL7_9ROSA|nr:hypothetical protein FNV43_RR09795 [Rhamnella rubrinervis]